MEKTMKNSAKTILEIITVLIIMAAGSSRAFDYAKYTLVNMDSYLQIYENEGAKYTSGFDFYGSEYASSQVLLVEKPRVCSDDMTTGLKMFISMSDMTGDKNAPANLKKANYSKCILVQTPSNRWVEIAVQKILVPYIENEVEVGDSFKVYYWLGGYWIPDKFSILLLNEFLTH